MIKKGSENCTATIKSYIIEDKTISFFSINNDYEIEYSKLIKNFFKYFYDNTPEEGLRSHLLTAFNRATKACELESDKKIDAAIAEWRKIFGDDFPATTKKEKQNTFDENIQRLYSDYPAKNEEYLDIKYGIKTNLNSVYTLKIDADIQQKAYRNDLLSNFLLKRLPLLKEKNLTFKITKNTVPPPYEVKWKVRNFGEEAKNVPDLRGEIYDDSGYEKRQEHTRYMGEHFVECYVIKNGVCVAKAKILVPIGNNY
jgi:hypothetical protein